MLKDSNKTKKIADLNFNLLAIYSFLPAVFLGVIMNTFQPTDDAIMWTQVKQGTVPVVVEVGP